MSDQSKFVVWPPVATASIQTWPVVAASVAWFAGHLASEIVLPVLDGALHDCALPSYIGCAALAEMSKVRIVPVSATDAQRLLQGLNDNDLVLMRSRDLVGFDPVIRLRRLTGSEGVSGVVETKDRAPSYYYIGRAEADRQDAYYAVCLTYWLEGGRNEEFLARSRERLLSLKVEAGKFDRVAVFGTGPSLVEAIDRDHGKAFNIVCNTIIKNKKFLRRTSPKVVVASDAHFHFSYHRYSARFLSDLTWAVEHAGAAFFTFDKFAAFVRKRLPCLERRVFGIPAGRSEYGYDLYEDFRVHPGESVLNMFLLPIASYLSDRVELNGFTGRSPTDAYFWAHSDLHQYVELMEDVRRAHPAFFDNRDYPGYAEKVDAHISERISLGRRNGQSIVSGTTTFYSAFQ